MKETLGRIFLGIIITLALFIGIYYISIPLKTTIYSIDKEQKDIWVWERNDKEYSTWYDFPVTTLYAVDGRLMICEDSLVEEQLSVGWYLEPMSKIYSLTEEKIIPQTEKQSMLDSGEWYEEPQIILYNTEGKKEIVPKAKEEEYLNKGYSKEYIEKKKVVIEKTAPKQVQKQSNVEKKSVGKDPFSISGFTPEQLEKCLDKGLSGYGQAFYNMEQTYGVNAVFAISVAELESGNGTSSAFRTKNNAFGIGPGKYFNSVEEGINYFGNLMNKSIYKNKSIDAIGSKYCVGGNWASKVKTLLNTNYAQIGV